MRSVICGLNFVSNVITYFFCLTKEQGKCLCSDQVLPVTVALPTAALTTTVSFRHPQVADRGTASDMEGSCE